MLMQKQERPAVKHHLLWPIVCLENLCWKNIRGPCCWWEEGHLAWFSYSQRCFSRQCTLHFGHHSFSVSLCWLRWFTCPKMLTHPTTDWAGCEMTRWCVLQHYRRLKPCALRAQWGVAGSSWVRSRRNVNGRRVHGAARNLLHGTSKLVFAQVFSAEQWLLYSCLRLTILFPDPSHNLDILSLIICWF